MNISVYTVPIFAIFAPYERAYVKMMDLYLTFQFVKGPCHGNQIMLRKCYQLRLIPLAFVALVLENELQYPGLSVCIISGDDGATSSKNLVNFCLVTLENICKEEESGTSYDQPVHQIRSLYVYSLRRYDRRQKCKNWGGLVG